MQRDKKRINFRKIIIPTAAVLFVLAFLLVLRDYGITGAAISGAPGGATGVAKVYVTCFTAMSLPQSMANFGAITQGMSEETMDNNPQPLLLQNDGGVFINVSLSRDAASAPLFSGTGGGDNSNSFQFKAAESSETGAFDLANSLTTWTKVPGETPLTAVAGLNYADGYDSAEIDLLINVPTDEPPGAKQENLNFIAYAANPDECEVPPETGEADCLTIDVSKAEFKCSEKKLKEIKLKNDCEHDITLTKAKVDWTSNDGEQMSNIKFEPSNSVSNVWDENCYWNCGPTGKQGSGIWLDFGENDYLLEKSKSKVKEIDFDSCLEDKTFKLEIELSDGSVKSSGDFQP